MSIIKLFNAVIVCCVSGLSDGQKLSGPVQTESVVIFRLAIMLMCGAMLRSLVIRARLFMTDILLTALLTSQKSGIFMDCIVTKLFLYPLSI